MRTKYNMNKKKRMKRHKKNETKVIYYEPTSLLLHNMEAQ